VHASVDYLKAVVTSRWAGFVGTYNG